MEVTGITNIGKIRSINEDSLLISCDLKPYFVLVADGMGGHAGGEVASRLATEEIANYIKKLNKKVLEKNDIEQAVISANKALADQVSLQPELKGMGTTLTFAFMEPHKLTIAHIGDSGAYLISDKNARKITKDHTYVQHLIDSGIIKTGIAEDYPFRNIITRALGMQNLKVDLYEENWSEGDILLLCTDGLSGYVNQEYMERELQNSSDIQTAAQNMVDFALDSGGKDNITIIIAKNSGFGEAAAYD